MKIVLGRRYRVKPEHWTEVWRNIERYVSRDEVAAASAQKVREIRRITAGKKCAIAWSGGKDSLVVQELAARAGIRQGVFAYTKLEYPAFMKWVLEHKPADVEAVCSGQDLAWLARNPDFLFPGNKKRQNIARWYSIVQHACQNRYYREHQLDMLLLGRRLADGNIVKRNEAGDFVYTNGQGITLYNCIAEWPHELTLGFIVYNKIPMPPVYEWKDGFYLGTHSWNQRDPRDNSDLTAWREVYEIDPSIVKEAAAYFPAAKLVMETEK